MQCSSVGRREDIRVVMPAFGLVDLIRVEGMRPFMSGGATEFGAKNSS
jgi:hypothetical protein